MKKLIFLPFLLFAFTSVSQIVIDNNPPYDVPSFLVDNILLGGGVVATNHTYQGEPSQIGWFDAVNTNLGIDNGIVMCTGDIYALDPLNGGGFTIIPNTVTDPDLLAVANSVPGLIGQTFSVSSVNDIAILEFDFIPTSDSMEFNYAFGSQEYNTYENTQYNDVFGFFLSGPGIAGPWANGAVNLAVVPNTNPPLPITISTIHDGQNGNITPINQQYFVQNQNGLNIIADADGFTTKLTARALVQCGETYHIKLAIADGSDPGLSSYVWLEGGSFFSPPLVVLNNLSIDSNIMEIPCNSSIVLTANGGSSATYQWLDSTSTVFSTDPTVTVGAGQYQVSADISGCATISEILTVISDPAPSIDLGPDRTIPCNSDIQIDAIVVGGTSPYNYSWSNGGSTNFNILGEGLFSLIVTDDLGCEGADSIEIFYDPPPVLTLGSDYNIPCNTTSSLTPNINGGTQPFIYNWSNGSSDAIIDVNEGTYILNVTDFYGCADSDEISITEDSIPHATIFGGGSACNDGTTVDINFTFNGLLPWDLVYTNGSSSLTINNISDPNYVISTVTAGDYKIVLADDLNDCKADTTVLGSTEVIINPLPDAIISPSVVVMYDGEQVELSAGDYERYEWFDGNDLLIDSLSTLVITDSGSYYVWVMDINGCTDFSEILDVEIAPLTQLFIPTAFTPNDDEHNELFVIKGISVNTYNIKIFNRWGDKLFESDDINKFWDGTFENNKVEQATYYYSIDVLGMDNKLFNKSGSIQVLY